MDITDKGLPAIHRSPDPLYGSYPVGKPPVIGLAMDNLTDTDMAAMSLDSNTGSAGEPSVNRTPCQHAGHGQPLKNLWLIHKQNILKVDRGKLAIRLQRFFLHVPCVSPYRSMSPLYEREPLCSYVLCERVYVSLWV